MFNVNNTLIESNTKEVAKCSVFTDILQQLGQAFLALLTESCEILESSTLA